MRMASPRPADYGRPMASSTVALRQLNRREARFDLARLVAVAGVAVLVYGAVFVQNFTTFTEIGLSRQLVGGDAPRYVVTAVILIGVWIAYSGLAPRVR